MKIKLFSTAEHDLIAFLVDLFFGLFERSAENCIQSVVSALHPNKIPDQTDEDIQGKVITLHSTSFYDERFAPKGKAFHEGCHLYTKSLFSLNSSISHSLYIMRTKYALEYHFKHAIGSGTKILVNTF